jgi:DNA-binding response OmpR family regulator
VTAPLVLVPMASTRSHPSRNRASLLVVEDDFLIGGMLCNQLQELGYSVLGPAYNLDEARQLALNAPVEGVLLDINLGAGRSTPIADILIAREIPILFVSGYQRSPDERLRGIPMLSKPFTMETLRAAVESLLDQS